MIYDNNTFLLKRLSQITIAFYDTSLKFFDYCNYY